MTKDQILNEAMALAPEELEALIEELNQSKLSGELTPEQWAEVQRRIEEADRGEVEPIPGEQAIEEMRRRFPR